MNKAVAGTVAGLLLAAAIAILWLWAQWDGEREQRERAQADVALLTSANMGLGKFIDYQQQARTVDREVVAEHARKQQSQARTASVLEFQQQEALRHAESEVETICPQPQTCPGPEPRMASARPSFDPSVRLSAAVANNLCLRWKAANGYTDGAANHQGNHAGSAAGLGAYPAAEDCGRWKTLTVRDSLEYIGDLLDRLAEERLKSESRQQWSREIENAGARTKGAR